MQESNQPTQQNVTVNVGECGGPYRACPCVNDRQTLAGLTTLVPFPGRRPHRRFSGTRSRLTRMIENSSCGTMMRRTVRLLYRSTQGISRRARLRRTTRLVCRRAWVCGR